MRILSKYQKNVKNRNKDIYFFPQYVRIDLYTVLWILIDNKDVWIIDFDKCKKDYCAHDLAYFLRRLLKRSTTNWNPALTVDIINTYLKINNLTDSDLKYILAYLAFPQKFWKVSRDYYKNINKCNKNSFIALFTKGLNRSVDQLDYINTMIEIFQTYYNVKF